MQKRTQTNSHWFHVDKTQEKSNDVTVCLKCGCSWLELISVSQYQKFHNIVLGQKPPTKQDVAFWIFKCPKCGELIEPTIQVGPRDALHKSYDQFLDHMLKDTKPIGEKI